MKSDKKFGGEKRGCMKSSLKIIFFFVFHTDKKANQSS